MSLLQSLDEKGHFPKVSGSFGSKAKIIPFPIIQKNSLNLEDTCVYESPNMHWVIDTARYNGLYMASLAAVDMVMGTFPALGFYNDLPVSGQSGIAERVSHDAVIISLEKGMFSLIKNPSTGDNIDKYGSYDLVRSRSIDGMAGAGPYHLSHIGNTILEGADPLHVFGITKTLGYWPDRLVLLHGNKGEERVPGLLFVNTEDRKRRYDPGSWLCLKPNEIGGYSINRVDNLKSCGNYK